MAEAIAGNLGAVGIRTRVRTMERAAFLATWGEKKLRGIVLGAQGAGGNAATRIEALATKEGRYAYGVLPEVEDLFERQAKELDRKKREEMLHQIQKILQRSGGIRADLGEWVHSRRGTQGGGAGPHPDPRLPVLGPVRGRPAQAAIGE